MVNWFNDLGIRTKLYTGFGLIGLLMVVIGATGMLSLSNAREDFYRFENTAGDALLASELNADMAKALQRSLAYIQSRDDAHSEGVADFVRQMREGLALARQEFVSPGRLAQVQEMEQALETFDTGFSRVQALYAERDDLVTTVLGPQGTAIRRSITDYLDWVAGTGNVDKIALTGQIQQHFLLARVYLWIYLSENQPSQIERVASEIAMMRDLLDELDAERNPTTQQFVRETMAAATAFGEAAMDVGALIAERNGLRDTALAQVGQSISDMAVLIKDEKVAEETAISHATSAAMEAQQTLLGAFVIASLIGAAILAIVMASALSNPVVRLTQTMRTLADGEYGVDVPHTERGDELGSMAQTVEVFKANALEREELERKAAIDRKAQDASYAATQNAISSFHTKVASILEVLSGKTGQMRSTATELNTLASGAEERAQTADEAAGETSESVQTVAAATEELASSIQEISRQVSAATEVVSSAADKSSNSVHEIEQLAEAGQKIGDVVNLIQDIAEQTNLLALNATIEAARAGEAGKGFAVVASEVKALAAQTAKATEEIAGQVSGIQNSTERAVHTIKEIAKMSDDLGEVTSSIASAVEEQGAATQEISNTTGSASESTAALAEGVTTLAEAIKQTGDAATVVDEASSSVAAQSDAISAAVQEFFDALEAASNAKTVNENDHTGEVNDATADGAASKGAAPQAEAA